MLILEDGSPRGSQHHEVEQTQSSIFDLYFSFFAICFTRVLFFNLNKESYIIEYSKCIIYLIPYMYANI